MSLSLNNNTQASTNLGIPLLSYLLQGRINKLLNVLSYNFLITLPPKSTTRNYKLSSWVLLVFETDYEPVFLPLHLI